MVAAAIRANALHDLPLAERLARAALDIGHGIDAGMELAWVLRSAGRHVEAEAVLAGLASSAERDDDRSLVAANRSLQLFWSLNRPDEAFAVALRVERTIAPGPWRDELVVGRATLHLLAGRLRDALELGAPHAAVTGRPMLTAAVAVAPALALMGRTKEAVAVADRAFHDYDLVLDRRVRGDQGIHVVSKILALVEAGYLEEAWAVATGGYEQAVAARDASGQAWMALQRGRVALAQGRLQAAGHAFAEAASIFADIDVVGVRRWALAGIALCAAQAAEPERAGAALDELESLGQTTFMMMEPDVDRARAWAAVADNDLAGARRWLTTAIARAVQSGAATLESAALHDLVRLGEPGDAVARLSELAFVIEGPLAPTRAAHAAALARHDADGLAGAAGSFSGAGAHLSAAEAWAQAAAIGDGRAAPRARAESGAAAARCEGAATPALRGGPLARLTRREREVAMLAAAGLASKEIAARLVVSTRTVENHLQHIYDKLGVAGRADLATALQGAV
jgi:DNA-binding CsgD family transcriptional regulator